MLSPEGRDLLDLGGVRLLIQRNEGRLSATLALDLYWHDLVIEQATRDGVLGSVFRVGVPVGNRFNGAIFSSNRPSPKAL